MARTRSHRQSTAIYGLTRTERLAMERAIGHAAELDHDGIGPYMDLADKVPEAWDTLARDVDVDEPREKITLYVDRSVAKFWKAQGKGYHERINRVLATYAQMQIAGVNKSNAWWRAHREERRREAAEAQEAAQRAAADLEAADPEATSAAQGARGGGEAK